MLSKKNLTVLALAISAIAWSAGDTAARVARRPLVRYPEGYRSWTHVKSMVLQPGHALYESFGGVHHIYANEPALRAMKAGRAYRDGAVIVFDLLDASNEGNAISEGARKIVGVMERSKRKFAATGGWGFEGFKADSRERVVTDPATACFGCHEQRKESNYVFSTYRP